MDVEMAMVGLDNLYVHHDSQVKTCKSNMATIPALEYTAIDDIPSISKRLRSTFNTHKTRPIEFRLTQLRKLYWRLALLHRF